MSVHHILHLDFIFTTCRVVNMVLSRKYSELDIVFSDFPHTSLIWNQNTFHLPSLFFLDLCILYLVSHF